ncbi:hypothetical protein [Hyphococcus sp.]|uniref:hypothetical protein n=1 Tax=Hyphococcus sp. TaxID=2038636 RepID=UPI0035C6CD95
MTDRANAETAREKIAELSDLRLQALAFRVWRAARSKQKKQRRRAMRLAPLFRAELKSRRLVESPAAE